MSRTEWLVVLAIVTLWLAFIYVNPRKDLRDDRDRMGKASATFDVREIAQAITAYRTEYGRFPSASSKVQLVEGPLLQTLMGSNALGLNPRQIAFMEVRKAKRGLSGITNDTLVDPWGSPYRILWDADGDGEILHPGCAYTVTNYLKTNVAVWNDPDTHPDQPDLPIKGRRAATSWETSSVPRLPRQEQPSQK